MSTHSHDAQPEKSNAIFVALYVLGGLCIGTGLVNLFYSFGWSGGSLNQDFAKVGFSGLDNLSALPPSDYSVPLLVIGILCLVFSNSNAWRRTGGY